MFWLGLGIGLVCGGFIGVVITAICAISGTRD